jgi:hypothetical protein
MGGCSRGAALRLLHKIASILKSRTDLSVPYLRSARLNAGRYTDHLGDAVREQ